MRGEDVAGEEEGAAEMTEEERAVHKARLIMTRVERDMGIVRDLLDTTHTKLAELELQTVKHSR